MTLKLFFQTVDIFINPKLGTLIYLNSPLPNVTLGFTMSMRITKLYLPLRKFFLQYKKKLTCFYQFPCHFLQTAVLRNSN